ncbi:MAG TPA: cysteine desulfurase-like protein [Ilumatobacteraceae bacterium]|nr:cysteine desulfurase-like protein [Ilumatobacteraceae bacterium]
MKSLRHRFPGVGPEWARFDGPAGTQMVDSAITAMSEWMASGNTAANGGPFAAAEECQRLMDRTRAAVGQFLGADPNGISFGPNMTSLTFAVSRAIGATLQPGDRIVGTRLDHDANITPWRRAADGAGAEHVLAPFDPATGQLPPGNVIELIDERTKWVTLPGASNLLGSTPDLVPIIEAAHAVGANVYIDAVHLAPHRRIDISALGCDALVTSPYKWYGPHSGVLWMRPDLLETLPVFKVRPAPDHGPAKLETGMPNFEAIAGVEAAARFLMEEGMDHLAAAEAEMFSALLEGLQSIRGVKVWGSQTLDGRVPTAAFTIDGVHPADAAKALGARNIAVWDGHNYAVEVVDQLGLADSGGVIRAGISRYVEQPDVDRLLAAVADLAN